MRLSIAFVVSLALVTGVPPSGSLAALDAVTDDGVLSYLARAGLTARAMDLASGAERWQVGLQDVDKVQAEVLQQ